MTRQLGILALLAVLPSCIAAIGNTGTFGDDPEAAAPHLHEKVRAGERIVQIREQALARVREAYEAGRADSAAVADAEVEVERARIELAQYRAEFAAATAKDKH